MKKTHTGWGGKREGAGRPAVENKKVSFTVRLDPETVRRIQIEAERLGVSRGKALDLMISTLYDVLDK